MTPTEQLADILNDLQNVLKTIHNEPEHIVPAKFHTSLKAAIYDSLVAIDITKKQINNFKENQKKTEEDIRKEKGYKTPLNAKQKKEIEQELAAIQAEKKAHFDAGLLNKAQMDFKYSICKEAYENLADHLNTPTHDTTYKEEVESSAHTFYDGLCPAVENMDFKEDNKKGKENNYSWKKRIGKKVGAFLPKLKTYLSAKRTLISSIAKVYDVQEKVSEVLGLIGVGITYIEPMIKKLNKKD